ncbi:MAG: hypothetical protein FWG79_09850 [Bacteroidales bacterium]|nr:hypothetical protein [Bacteroidales bacterium]
MTPFNKPHVNRPLYPKHTVGSTDPEPEPIPYRKLIIEATITVIATIVLQEVIMKMFTKK